MYILIEADKPFTYKMVCIEINEAAIRKVDNERWILIGLDDNNIEQKIATFQNQTHAYQALQELFEVITTGGDSWDAVEFKKNIEMPF